MTALPRLVLDSIDVLFGQTVGLKGIAFSVDAGETVAIVGTSGAGKSSLLRSIAGLDSVARGRIEIDGTNRTSSPPETRGAVYLHQTPLLFPHLSVAGNVAFPLRVRGGPPNAVDARVAEVLDKLGLTSLARRAPDSLSGGQRHRVALARAIAARPPVLLLDEPLAALDPALREEALAAIRSAAAEYNPATLFVTHDLAEAGAIGDRIAVLLEGRIRQLAPPAEIFEHPTSSQVAKFVGFSNRVDGTVERGSFHSGAWTIPMQTEIEGHAVLLFRPRSLLYDGAGDLPGEVLSIAATPAGPRLRARIHGVDMEASVGGSEPRPRVGPGRFRLDLASARLFTER